MPLESTQDSLLSPDPVVPLSIPETSKKGQICFSLKPVIVLISYLVLDTVAFECLLTFIKSSFWVGQNQGVV